LIGDAEQYGDLTRLYAEFGDDELIAQGRAMGDLTETAQEVLKGELARRRLSVAPAEKTPIVDTVLDDELSLPPGFAWMAPERCIKEFAESEDALAAMEMLRAEGIACEVILPRGGYLDMGAPRLAVAPADSERAATLLSVPIPEEFRALVRTRDQFVVPTCQGCGAPDPLLEEIEPTNKWRCEVCDRVWIDG
jgi:hypothetical protein